MTYKLIELSRAFSDQFSSCVTIMMKIPCFVLYTRPFNYIVYSFWMLKVYLGLW